MTERELYEKFITNGYRDVSVEGWTCWQAGREPLLSELAASQARIAAMEYQLEQNRFVEIMLESAQAKLAASQAQVRSLREAVPEWISVEDRLPDMEIGRTFIPVLAYRSSNPYPTMTFYKRSIRNL